MTSILAQIRSDVRARRARLLEGNLLRDCHSWLGGAFATLAEVNREDHGKESCPDKELYPRELGAETKRSLEEGGGN